MIPGLIVWPKRRLLFSSLLIVLALAGAEAGMRFLAARGRPEMTATHC